MIRIFFFFVWLGFLSVISDGMCSSLLDEEPTGKVSVVSLHYGGKEVSLEKQSSEKNSSCWLMSPSKEESSGRYSFVSNVVVPTGNVYLTTRSKETEESVKSSLNRVLKHPFSLEREDFLGGFILNTRGGDPVLDAVTLQKSCSDFFETVEPDFSSEAVRFHD